MKHRLRLLAASLALTSFLPAYPVIAAEEPVPAEESTTPTEEVSAPAEEVAAPEETVVEAETNVDYLNYLELEDFIISAERIPTNKWDTPANVHIITAKEIEDNHYQSVSEALNHVNGVLDSNSYMQMDGGKRVLVLVDGKRWFDPQISSQDLKAFTAFPSMKMIERIEVVKGGNSALYGSDAFSGVVNIITKKGTRNETTIDLNTGTWRQHQYEITNQGVADKFSWFITGRLNKSHAWDYKNGSNNLWTENSYRNNWWKVNTTENSSHNFSARLDQRFDDRSSLTLDVTHISDHTRTYNNYYRYYLEGSSSYLVNNVALSYNFKEGTSIPGWFRYVNNYFTSRDDYSTENPNARMQGIEYQNGWELGQHKIIAGLEWHKSSAKYSLYGVDKSMNTKSVYLQDTISMGDKWTVIPGVRYDHSSEFGTNWSPKLAANYRPDERTKFYASWGKSYNVPLLFELYAGDPPYGTEDWNNLYDPDLGVQYIRGNKNLRPEKGYSLNMGIEHDFDEKTGFTFNFFQNKMKHALWWDTSPHYSWDYNNEDWYVDYYYQGADNHIPIKSRGVELTFHQKLDDHFSYDLGYSHTHSNYEHDNLGNVPYYRPQPNGYRLGVHYNNRGLKVNLLGTMASGISTRPGYKWSNTDIIDAYAKRRYAIFDLNISYDLNENTTFYFKALNLTNQHYSNEESTWFEETESSWGYKGYVPGAGRQFIYGMNYKF